MNKVLAAAHELQAFCEEQNWRYRFIEAQLTPLLEIKSDSSSLPRLREVRTNFGGRDALENQSG